MALNEYVVDINGLPHTMQLSEQDAKRFGDAATPANKAEKPAAKSHTPQNKAKTPAANKAEKPAAPAPDADDASDPGASE